MSTVTQPQRELCLTCRRARAACWCPQLEPQRIAASLVVLQHPREARNPVGTARMAHLSWEGSHLRTGVDFSQDPVVCALREEPGMRHALIYPSADAHDARELADITTPLRLYLVDGTWAQARKIYRRNRWMHALPAYRIQPDAPGNYRIRKEPAPHCLSTVESVAWLAGLLNAQPSLLLRPFNAMVEHQLHHVANTHTPRHRRAPRPVAPKRVPEELAAWTAQLLLVHAEGNGWPARVVSGVQTELVHLLAYRPASGQRFEAWLKPRSMAPNLLSNLGLDTLGGQETREAFLARWQAFAQPTDVWATWGYFPVNLAVGAGVPMPAVVNVQLLAHRQHMKRLPGVEAAAAAAGGAPGLPMAAGRGGIRMAALEQVVRSLLHTESFTAN